MKITFDTNTDTWKVKGHPIEDLTNAEIEEAASAVRRCLLKSTKMTEYEEDSMWMSYRYCIGRKTIACAMRAGDIAKECYGRLSEGRSVFTAFDINREIESKLRFMDPMFHFPSWPLNRIYSTAVDIVCDFIEEYNINSIDEFIKYRDVNVIITDNVNDSTEYYDHLEINEGGYKFETTTWEEWLRPQVREIVAEYYDLPEITEESAWRYYELWNIGKDMTQKEIIEGFERITKDIPNPEHYYMTEFEDLFEWNDLCHLFDLEHHHTCTLIDDSKCEYFWSWTPKTDEHGYKTFGYKRIRVPVDKWNGRVTTWIPDSSIKTFDL